MHFDHFLLYLSHMYLHTFDYYNHYTNYLQNLQFVNKMYMYLLY